MRLYGAAALVVAMLVLGVPAAASTHGNDGDDWVPTSTPPFLLPAGQFCAFEVKGDIIRDHERIRTLARYPDGTPRAEDFDGPLVNRYTNTSNNKSAVRAATGQIRAYHLGDGYPTAGRVRLIPLPEPEAPPGTGAGGTVGVLP